MHEAGSQVLLWTRDLYPHSLFTTLSQSLFFPPHGGGGKSQTRPSPGNQWLVQQPVPVKWGKKGKERQEQNWGRGGGRETHFSPRGRTRRICSRVAKAGNGGLLSANTAMGPGDGSRGRKRQLGGKQGLLAVCLSPCHPLPFWALGV